MSNDIDIKKILEDFSKMKTKFFIDPPKIGVDKEFLKEDRKRLLMEAPQETRPIRGREGEIQLADVRIIAKDSANKNLRVATNCLTGEEIVSPNIIVYEQQHTPNVELWFAQQQSFSSKRKSNWIDACKYYYEGKVKINNKAYQDWKNGGKKTEEPFFGNYKPYAKSEVSKDSKSEDLGEDQISWTTFCLKQCFANSEQFEVGCAVRFNIIDIKEATGPSFEDYIDPKFKEYKKFDPEYKEYGKLAKTVTLTHQAWWAYYVQYYPKVKKEIDAFLNAEKNGTLKENWWTSMPNFFSDDWQNKIIQPWESMEIDKWGYSVDMGNDTYVKFEEKNLNIYDPDTGQQGETFYQYLPLTKEELSAKRSENPYNEDGRLKLGAGKYICMKPGSSQVNYRTSAGVNEDSGIFDPYDNWIAWGSSEIIGKLLEEKEVARALPGGQTRYDPIHGQTIYTYHIWYKVELFSPVQDKYDTEEIYDEVWVSSQTTQYCEMDKGNTQVSGTSFQQQSLYTSPMVPLKNPVGKKLQWSQTVSRPGFVPFKEKEGYDRETGDYIGPSGIHYPGLGPKF